jgi:hypothetical protein
MNLAANFDTILKATIYVIKEACMSPIPDITNISLNCIVFALLQMTSPFYAMITCCYYFYDVLETMVERRYNRSIPFHLPEYILNTCTTESETRPKIPKQHPFLLKIKGSVLKSTKLSK